MDIKTELWGEVNGQPVFLYTLSNDDIQVKITNYGGRITSLKAPDKNGNRVDVVLGFNNLEDYLDDNPYFGSIVGRYCNRIAGGKFELESKEYNLFCNEGENHLHGGYKGFESRVWKAKAIKEDNDVRLILNYLSPDGEEGYPGNLAVTVTYILTADNELEIEYRAETDKTTVVNLTNHSYFNLNGAKGDILDHKLMVNADFYTPTDKDSIPTGAIEPVRGTPLDFNQPVEIGKRIEADFEQLKFAGGYDHNYVLNEDVLSPAAILTEPENGIKMEVYTDEPGIQVYTGNYLEGSLTGKEGKKYRKNYAVCLETQHFPDSPHQFHFPSTILEPGEEFESTTVYKFTQLSG